MLEPVAWKAGTAGSEGPRRSNAPGLPDETWFGIITRQAIRRGTFATVNVLINQIRDYLAHWNTNPKPFTWTATADDG